MQESTEVSAGTRKIEIDNIINNNMLINDCKEPKKLSLSSLT